MRDSFSSGLKGMWFEEMINNRNKSVVRDMKWTKDGKKICIVYEDGAVIVGSVDGKRMWSRDVNLELALVEWSPDGRTIIFCSVCGECRVYDENGNHLSNLSILIPDQYGLARITGIDWHESAGHSASYVRSRLVWYITKI
jgi:WD repeat-containing protein 35